MSRLRGVSFAVLAGLLFAPAALAAAFSGTVRSEQGALLSGMTVAAYDSAGTQRAAGSTDQQARYQLNLPAGTYRLLAYDPAGVYATAFYGGADSFETTPELEMSAAQAAVVDFSLQRAGYASGIVSGGGLGVATAVVTAYNLNGTRRAFTRTDAGGNYSLALPPGEYKIVAWDDSATFGVSFHASKSDFASADHVVISSGVSSAIDFRLPRDATVSGRALSGSTVEPLENITVTAYDRNGVVAGAAMTDSTGRFTLQLTPSVYRLVAYDPSGAWATAFQGGVESFDLIAPLSLGEGEIVGNLDIYLYAAGSVEGTVTGRASGSPVKGVMVVAYNASGTRRQFVTTDAAGRYSIVLPAGEFHIGVHDDNLIYAPRFFRDAESFVSSTAVSIVTGEKVAGADIALDRFAYVSGRVTTTGALPIASVFVEAYAADGTLVASTVTGGDGRYRLRIAPGQRKIVAADPASRFLTLYYPASSTFDSAPLLDVADGQQRTGIDFVLAPSGAAGRQRPSRLPATSTSTRAQ